MKSRAFTLGGLRSDQSHVQPRTCEYTQHAKGENPALIYTDARGDKRIFGFDRYTLSMHLPTVVARLDQCKDYHAGHGNYFRFHW